VADLDLDALQALADAATPGPWEEGFRWVYTLPVYPDDNRLSNVLGMDCADDERATVEQKRSERNVAFIAAARQAVPDLIAEVRRLRLAVGALTLANDTLDSGARQDRERMQARIDAALDAVEDCIGQACDDGGPNLDSMALSAYARGMRLLAQHGRLVIDSEYGRRVIGHWPTVKEAAALTGDADDDWRERA